MYALTKADIRAVGPNVWNGFKEQLLKSLFDPLVAPFKAVARMTDELTYRSKIKKVKILRRNSGRKGSLSPPRTG